MANTYKLKTKNTCIITGVAGYIGLNLAEFFLKQDYKVYGIDNFCSGDRKGIKKLKIKFKNFIFFESDVEKFKKKIYGNNLIHLAAQSSVQRSSLNPIETIKMNILSLKPVLDIATRAKVRNFLFASSSAVYGDHGKKRINEQSKTNAKSIYAISKLANEIKLSLFSKKSKMKISILRFFNVYGGQKKKSKYSSVINLWTKRIIRNRKIILHDKGTVIRDFVHIDDLCNLFKKIIVSPKIYKCEIFNVSNGLAIKLSYFLKILLSSIEKNYEKKYSLSKIVNKKTPSDAIRFSIGDNKKIVNFFKYKSKITLKNGINQFIRDY